MFRTVRYKYNGRDLICQEEWGIYELVFREFKNLSKAASEEPGSRGGSMRHVLDVLPPL